MKIQKINDSKIRVVLDYKELENSNISTHSFLANSIMAKGLINSIISFLNKELNFSKSYENITYDILSLQNKVFIIIFSKELIGTNILYDFNNQEELQIFINSLKKYIYLEDIPYSIYSSNSNYSVSFDISKKDCIWRRNFLSVLSEFK